MFYFSNVFKIRNDGLKHVSTLHKIIVDISVGKDKPLINILLLLGVYWPWYVFVYCLVCIVVHICVLGLVCIVLLSCVYCCYIMCIGPCMYCVIFLCVLLLHHVYFVCCCSIYVRRRTAG